MIVSFCFSFIFLHRIHLYCVYLSVGKRQRQQPPYTHSCNIHKNANGIGFNRIDSRGFSTCLMRNPRHGGDDAWRYGKTLYYNSRCEHNMLAMSCARPSIDINELVFSFWIFSSFISFGSVGRWRVCFAVCGACMAASGAGAVSAVIAVPSCIMRILCLTFINFRLDSIWAHVLSFGVVARASARGSNTVNRKTEETRIEKIVIEFFPVVAFVLCSVFALIWWWVCARRIANMRVAVGIHNKVLALVVVNA